MCQPLISPESIEVEECANFNRTVSPAPQIFWAKWAALLGKSTNVRECEQVDESGARPTFEDTNGIPSTAAEGLEEETACSTAPALRTRDMFDDLPVAPQAKPTASVITLCDSRLFVRPRLARLPNIHTLCQECFKCSTLSCWAGDCSRLLESGPCTLVLNSDMGSADPCFF